MFRAFGLVRLAPAVGVLCRAESGVWLSRRVRVSGVARPALYHASAWRAQSADKLAEKLKENAQMKKLELEADEHNKLRAKAERQLKADSVHAAAVTGEDARGVARESMDRWKHDTSPVAPIMGAGLGVKMDEILNHPNKAKSKPSATAAAMAVDKASAQAQAQVAAAAATAAHPGRTQPKKPKTPAERYTEAVRRGEIKNWDIQSQRVRLLAVDKQQIGVMSLTDAMSRAESSNCDLQLITEKGDAPVAQLMKRTALPTAAASAPAPGAATTAPTAPARTKLSPPPTAAAAAPTPAAAAATAAAEADPKKKKRAVSGQQKVYQMRSTIDAHDLKVKTRMIVKQLTDGQSVRVVLMDQIPDPLNVLFTKLVDQLIAASAPIVPIDTSKFKIGPVPILNLMPRDVKAHAARAAHIANAKLESNKLAAAKKAGGKPSAAAAATPAAAAEADAEEEAVPSIIEPTVLTGADLTALGVRVTPPRPDRATLKQQRAAQKNWSATIDTADTNGEDEARTGIDQPRKSEPDSAAVTASLLEQREQQRIKLALSAKSKRIKQKRRASADQAARSGAGDTYRAKPSGRDAAIAADIEIDEIDAPPAAPNGPADEAEDESDAAAAAAEAKAEAAAAAAAAAADAEADAHDASVVDVESTVSDAGAADADTATAAVEETPRFRSKSKYQPKGRPPADGSDATNNSGLELEAELEVSVKQETVTTPKSPPSS